uniref:Syndecan n=1 Tax=Heliocidaris crassispina TaxID=1043166 RepID=Q966T3_HELCR|nr:syndecan core protein [Heliocidaris crassispina]
MRVILLCGALLVALIGTCSGEVNDGTINIDEMTAMGDTADIMADTIDGGELSGDGPNNVVGSTTDDEDLATDMVEGSGTNKQDIVDPMSFTTISSKITTSNNNIQENYGRPKTTISNALGPIYNEDEIRYKNGNEALGGAKPNDVNEEPQDFFKMIFENPAILAGMVGAVVLILLTVVLLFLFVIYRIKKKDEGSYSLDEPHKVKDPTAYWKDTKEFYA